MVPILLIIGGLILYSQYTRANGTHPSSKYGKKGNTEPLPASSAQNLRGNAASMPGTINAGSPEFMPPVPTTPPTLSNGAQLHLRTDEDPIPLQIISLDVSNDPIPAQTLTQLAQNGSSSLAGGVADLPGNSINVTSQWVDGNLKYFQTFACGEVVETDSI